LLMLMAFIVYNDIISMWFTPPRSF
jgi:hypothetical protein